jgi:hypothetical protein
MDKGQALIGCYKRGLRIAMEFVARGHDVFVFCTGRQFYHDELTRRAEAVVQFVEFPFSTARDAAQESFHIPRVAVGACAGSGRGRRRTAGRHLTGNQPVRRRTLDTHGAHR